MYILLNLIISFQFVWVDGHRRTPYIVGGRYSKKGEFPFAVSLQNINSRHFCGGVIYTLKTVVTACHCSGTFVSDRFIQTDPREINVLGGSINLKDKKGNQLRKVSQLIRHPLCQTVDSTWIYDFALLILEKEFKAGVGLQTMPIYSDDLRKYREFKRNLTAGRHCQVVGWGYQNAQNHVYGNPSKIQKVAIVKIINRTSCLERLCSSPKHVCLPKMDKNAICAVRFRGDSCSGDSGGPLICSGYIAGITSWGIYCGEYFPYPTVYSSIENLLNFPRSEIKRSKYRPDKPHKTNTLSNSWKTFSNPILTLILTLLN